jgi:hypothetical protein
MEWDELFSNASKPLIIDLGCGFGINLLSLSDKDSQRGSRFNFLGCDLSEKSLRYARGISKRWGLSKTLAYVTAEVENCVDALESYPGPIAWAFINFPTPYKFELLQKVAFRNDICNGSEVVDRIITDDDTTVEGNKQLPQSLSEFMVTRSLLEKTVNVFKTHLFLYHHQGVLIQTNVEDVAVVMDHLVSQTSGFGLSSIGLCRVNSTMEANQSWEDVWLANSSSEIAENVLIESINVETSVTLRQQRWRGMGGRQATGPGWLLASPLGAGCLTETEAAYQLDEKPVYRAAYIL